MENLECLDVMEQMDVMEKWEYLDFLVGEALLEHLANKESKVWMIFTNFFLQNYKFHGKNIIIFKGDAGDGGINSPGIKGSRGVDGRPGNKVFNKISVKSISRKFL